MPPERHRPATGAGPGGPPGGQEGWGTICDVPDIRPFRALRFDADAVGDLAAVISPPYDVISPAQQAELARRNPRNVVRLDLPLDAPGDEPESKYRRAARDFAAWRSDGALRKDRESSLYVYEQTYRVPGSDAERRQRGFFGRLRLEPLGEGILPHERTLSGPKEDRYRLLRATGVNFSPVVVLYRDSAGHAAAHAIERLAGGMPTTDVVADDGVRHRLWQVAANDPDLGPTLEALRATAAAAPVTIADGHHRYETALRYHDERHRDRAVCEEAPFDFLLALFLAIDEPLTVLPTHRVVRGGASGDALVERAASLFDVEPVESAGALAAAFRPGEGGAPAGATGTGRFGLWTGGRGAILRARRDAFEPLVDRSASECLRWLDVSLLAIALERLAGLDRGATTAGGRLEYTKDAAEAVAIVERGDAHSAFLLDPTPVEAVLDVAAAGRLMPQKSTYFYPKPATGLVFHVPGG